MGNAGRTAKEPITNNLIYNVLTAQVMPALAEIEKHLTRLNGRADHLENRSEAHTGRLGSIEDDCLDLSTRLGRVEGAEGARAEQIRDVKARHEILDSRVVQVSLAVAKWGAVGLGVFTGIAKGLEALAGALRP